MEKYAIIDIGSNAIRLAVYDSNNIDASEIYCKNFKSDLRSLFMLDELDTKHNTYLIFAHFLHIFKQFDVKHVKCISTAVLREQKSADKFQEIIKQKFNIDIKIISGEEEARLGALAVLTGIPGAKGIVADFGGGSLEIAEVGESAIGTRTSIPTRDSLSKESNVWIESFKKELSSKFQADNYDNLYFIGGILRRVGRMYMQYTRYPISNLHNMQIAASDFSNYLNHLPEIVDEGYISLEARNAFFVVQTLVEALNPSNIVISGFGLKEGLLFDLMAPSEREKNIILARCKKFTNYSIEKFDIQKYKNLIFSVFPASPGKELEEIIEMSLMFFPHGKEIDINSKADYIAKAIMSAMIPFTSKQRIMLSIIAYLAHKPALSIPLYKASRKILLFSEITYCKIISNVLKLIIEIDGLELKEPSFSIFKDSRTLKITSSYILPGSMFSKVRSILRDIQALLKKLP